MKIRNPYEWLSVSILQRWLSFVKHPSSGWSCWEAEMSDFPPHSRYLDGLWLCMDKKHPHKRALFPLLLLIPPFFYRILFFLPLCFKHKEGENVDRNRESAPYSVTQTKGPVWPRSASAHQFFSAHTFVKGEKKKFRSTQEKTSRKFAQKEGETVWNLNRVFRLLLSTFIFSLFPGLAAYAYLSLCSTKMASILSPCVCVCECRLGYTWVWQGKKLSSGCRQ